MKDRAAEPLTGMRERQTHGEARPTVRLFVMWWLLSNRKSTGLLRHP